MMKPEPVVVAVNLSLARKRVKVRLAPNFLACYMLRGWVFLMIVGKERNEKIRKNKT